MNYEDNVLFLRRNSKTIHDDTQEDIWDDSALIKAYDKAVNLAKKEVAERLGLEESQEKHNKISNEQRQSRRMRRKWCVGSPCRAVYSEDGELYEAIITKINENNGTCIVRFIGYENSEKVELTSLLESEGLKSQIAQQKASSGEKASQSCLSHAGIPNNLAESRKLNGIHSENMDCDTDEMKFPREIFTTSRVTNSNFIHGMETMSPAPPLPPLISSLPENDADALSSMLMSWYMNGFHTGYYHGLKQSRISQDKNKR